MSDLSEINIRETNTNPFETSDNRVANNSNNNPSANRQNSEIVNLQEQIGAAQILMVSNISNILEKEENLHNLDDRSNALKDAVN
jgi:hypothetical protein